MTGRACVGGMMAVLTAIVSTVAVRADILVRNDGFPIEGKIISQTSGTVVFQPERGAPLTFDRRIVGRVVTLDATGAIVTDTSATTRPALRWNVPPEPAAPPIAARATGPTFYVIPLHGEVGVTVLASALEKSLADAVARKATVVVLDIDSPGGLVEEAKKIMEVIHRYNKQTRIVALANQDLSAAAILSLSCRQIFVKATGTIGAAVAYNPSNLTLPPKLEEKMQSAWRAVARNSAEEGGHEPLLAEAMIDNTLELHMETVAGKTVVKEGPGDRTLCRMGKILTLSSHEAVECGLATAQADDFSELGKALTLADWTECPGLAGPLADYLPQRATAFKAELDKIHGRLEQDIQEAIQFDPTRSTVTVIHTGPRMPITHGPHIGPRSVGPLRGPDRTVTITHPESPANWHTDALRCVLALVKTEADLKDTISLCEAFGQSGQAEAVSQALHTVSEVRAQIYASRNQYAAAGIAAAAPTAPAAPAEGVAVLTPTMTRTALLGGPGGGEFTTVNPTGGPVIGFQYAFGEWGGKRIMRQVEPIFVRPPAGQSADPASVIARDGFVVGGLIVKYDNVSTIAVRVIFCGYRDGVVDADSTYTTDWIGTAAPGQTQQLAGHGEKVVGTFGHKGMNLDALGLVVVGPDTSVHQVAPSVAVSPTPAPLVGAMAIPDAASQARALKLVAQLYEPYPPKEPAQRQELAAKMLDQGLHTTTDPTARYVLLREAQTMAAGAGDFVTAMSAIDAMAASFPIDAVALSTSTLDQAAVAQPTPASPRLLEWAIKAADRASAADRYDDALRAMTLAELWAKSAKDSATVADAQARRAAVLQAQKDFARFADAQRKLQTAPADPQANLAAGKFKCFDKNDWKSGLPLLAKGSDAAIKAVADLEVAGPSTKDAQMEVAGDWWDLSDKNADVAHAMRARAAYWYKRLLPQLTPPLETALAEKRLAAAGASPAELAAMGDPAGAVPPVQAANAPAAAAPSPGSQTMDVTIDGRTSTGTYHREIHIEHHNPAVGGDPGNINSLADAIAMTAGGDPRQLQAAATWLFQVEVDPASREKVLAALKPHINDDANAVRKPFVQAFAHWATRDQAPDLRGIVDVPDTTKVMNGHEECWAIATAGLVRLDPEKAVDALEKRIDNFFYRVACNNALTPLAEGEGPEKALAAQFVLRLKDPNSTDWIKSSKDALRLLTSDRSPQQQKLAAGALAKLEVEPAGRAAVLSALKPFLNQPVADARLPFVQAFAHWATKEQVNDLLGVVNFPETVQGLTGQERVWSAAVVGLVRLDPASASRAVDLRMSDFFFRNDCAAALRPLAENETPQRAFAAALIERLRHPPR